MMRPGRQRGYILIYALAILLFLAGTVTGAAYALRLNAREATQQREQLRAEFRLRGALHYALAQFSLAALAQTATAAATAPATGPSEKPEPSSAGWRLEASAHQLQIDGAEVSIAIDDPGGIADANVLDERMWSDYFAALGIAQPDQAQRWAAAVIAWKERIGKANGRGGFAGIDDLLMLDALPATVRYGGWAAAQRPTTGQAPGPGLPDLFLAGSGERVFDLNRAALPLLAAATGAGAEQLAAYRAARERGKLTLADAVRLLGERALPLLQESRTDPVLRIVLTTATAGAGRLSLAAFAQRRDGQVQVLASRLGPVSAADVEQ